MLTRDGCQRRRLRLWDRVPQDVEWLLITDPRHVHYLCNFWIEPLSFSSGERGLLLLERNEAATLLVDNFTLRSSASDPFVDREVVEEWYDHRHSVANRDHALLAALKVVSTRLRGRRGLVEAEWFSVAAREAAALDDEAPARGAAGTSEEDGRRGSDLGSLLRELRRQKEPDEIDLLKQCTRAAEAGHFRAREVIREGLSEFEMYREVQTAALEAAGRPGLVYGDFRAVNAAKPKAGGLPTDYAFQKGDLLILDYSLVLDGYRCDFTNTLSVGEPSNEQMMVFQLCETALREGEKRLGPGVTGRDVFRATSGPFEEAGYGELVHHAGHGLGLGHPEPPILVPEGDDTLLAGDVITLEPGLYVEGIGGVRIEHNYLVTETGFERLSNHLISLT